MAEQSEEYKKAVDLQKAYKKDKTAYEKLKADTTKVKDLKGAIAKAQATLNRMEATNIEDETNGRALTHSKDDLEKQKKEVEKATKALSNHEAKLKKAEEKVNSRFSELEKIPGMKDYLNSVLARRLEKSMKKSQSEIDTYEKLKEIMQEHPNIEATVKGIVNSNRKISSLQSKIEKIENIPEAERTDEQKQTLENLKKELLEKQGSNEKISLLQSEIEKIEKIPEAKRTDKQKQTLKSLKEEFVEEMKTLEGKKLAMHSFLSKQYPEITEEQEKIIFALTTSDMDRAIAGKEKDIQNRQEEYEGIMKHKYEIGSREASENKERKASGNTGKGGSGAPLPAKLSRWQRFKNWIKKAWNGELGQSTEQEPKPEPEPEPEPEVKNEKPERASSQFRSLYRVEKENDPKSKDNILNDYVNKKEKEMEEIAKKVRKANKAKKPKEKIDDTMQL